MRSRVLRHHGRLARQSALFALVIAAASGCSSDWTRFDRSLYTNSVPASGAQPVGGQVNPYPGDVDATTTASIGPRRAVGPRPAGNVAPRPVVPDHGGYQPLQPPQNGYQPAANSYAPRQPYDAGATGQYGAASPAVQPVQRARLPEPQTGAAGIDPVTVASVPQDGGATDTLRVPQQAGDAAQTGRAQGGWSTAGGTSITLQPGETLFNLSKRYGVPVSALMRANGISDADNVQAGQRIVVPTYVYSRQAPISAPDANRSTRLARASRGSLVVPAIDTVPVPSRNPLRVASLQTGTTTVASAAPAGDPGIDPVVTGSVRSDTQRTDSRAPAAEQQQQAAAPAETPERTGIGTFRWPVRGRVITGFGETDNGRRNDGIDISVPEGTAVKAAENGVVIYAGSELEGFGNLVLLRHGGGWVTAYAHNKRIEVNRGDVVRRGQVIARSGRTGETETPKLHFELRRNSAPVDPMKHLGS